MWVRHFSRVMWPTRPEAGEGGLGLVRMAAVFVLIVGCLWSLLVVWLFLSIAGVADMPQSLTMTALYWCGMLVGPLTLIIGSALSLRRTHSRTGFILIAIGCLIFTGFALYNSINGMQRKPLQAPPLYSF